jgi:hypothetical protein
MGQFVRGATTITYGSRKVDEGYTPVIHINGISQLTQIGRYKHAKSAWRKAKRLAHQIWLRLAIKEIINRPADLVSLHALVGGDVPMVARLTHLDYNSIRGDLCLC